MPEIKSSDRYPEPLQEQLDSLAAPASPETQQSESLEQVSPEPTSRNEKLLLDNPELAQFFWKDDRWIVTDKSFQALLTTLGVEHLAESTVIPPEQDIFNQNRADYQHDLSQVSTHDIFARVTPDSLHDTEELLNTLSFDTREIFGFNDVESETNSCVWIQPTIVENRDSWTVNDYHIHLYRLNTPHASKIDRAVDPEDNALDACKALEDTIQKFVDKAGQRATTETLHHTGIYNPRYQDIRMINPPPNIIHCKDIDISSVPTADEIIETVENAPGENHIWIVENEVQGFVVVHEDNDLYVRSLNNAISGDINFAGASCDDNPPSLNERKDALREFFELLKNRSQLSMAFLAKEQPSPYDPQQVVQEIQAHPTPLFIKGTRTSGGALVVRHTRLPTGESILESDSPEFGNSLSITLQSLKRTLSFSDANASLTNQLLPNFLSRCSSAGTLKRILGHMETPIIEEEIPVARYTTKLGIEKCEFRAIFQGSDTPELVGSYAKASLKDIAANISIAGRGRHTVQVIRGIMQQRLEGKYDQTEINSRATKTLERFEQSVTQFATGFADKLSTVTPLRDFAVDVVPTWNTETDDIDFYLLEVQYAYGYEGLRAVAPGTAEQVTSFKEKKAQLRKTFTVVDRINRLRPRVN